MANPFAFRPLQVTFWTTAVYLALLIPLVVINEGVPPVKYDHSRLLDSGLNLTEAWLDLDNITQGFHHQNSHQNDVVRNYLLLRIEEILASNGVAARGDDRATVFDDRTANVTFSQAFGDGVPVHYQGSNVYVYIRGKDDVDGEWWHDASPGIAVGKGGVLVNAHFDSVSTAYGATDDGMGVATVLQLVRYFTTPGHQPRRGVVALLNNAEEPGLLGAAAFGKSPLLPFVHTFLNLEGAGAGGRCMLFRTTDREVTSAYANVQSPFGSVLGSDGFRMGLIRSGTDYSVWHDVYGQRGLDLAFFRPRALYHTNLDDARHASRRSLWQMMADATTTVINLSAETGNDFVGERPDGARGKAPNGRPSDGVWFDLFGSSFVLFGLRDMFAWSLTLLIAGPLILFLLFWIVQRQEKAYIFSSKLETSDSNSPDGSGDPVRLGGLKGIFRFPLALVVAGALVVGAALLIRKINPFIIYSSEYVVWSMMISLFYFAFWAIMRGADFARPSALHRLYVHLWLFLIGWAGLVAVTVLEDRFRIASGYTIVFAQSQIFLATVVGVCELFSLPRKSDVARGAEEEAQIRDHLDAMPRSDALISPSPGEQSAAGGTEAAQAGSQGEASSTQAAQNGDDEDDEDDGPATEETPLFRKSHQTRLRTSFARSYRRSISTVLESSSNRHGSEDAKGRQPYGKEQAWSGGLVSWTWLLQFLLLAPFTIVLVAQIGLLITSAVNQTGTDGSNLLSPYLFVAALTVVLLLPVTPFVHRVRGRHVPLFLLVVFAATLIYSLVAFPFSHRAPYKAFFKQTLDLDTGATRVRLTGVEHYIRSIIADLPSAAGQEVVCVRGTNRVELSDCEFDASRVPPNPAYGSGNESLELPPGVPPTPDYYAKLVTVRASRGSRANSSSLNTNEDGDRSRSVRLHVDAVNTRVVELRFSADGPAIRSLSVVGADPWDDRFGAFPRDGARTIRLWRREWTGEWAVDLTWDANDDDDNEDDGDNEDADRSISGGSDETEKKKKKNKTKKPVGLDGFAVGLWSDANDAAATMPAFYELVAYAPTWAVISKAAPGLVEGAKAFQV